MNFKLKAAYSARGRSGSRSRSTNGNRRYGLILVALVTTLVSSHGAAAKDDPADHPRGGRVGWARLITSDGNWNVHGGNDPMLADFVRTQTTLNLDATTYSANPGNLAQLCSYPLIFTNNLVHVRGAKEFDNIREYLKRGGFLWVDACENPSITGMPFSVFRNRHAALFANLFPKAELRLLRADHEIYSCYFAVNLDLLYRQKPGANTSPAPDNGVYGLFEGGRMVALLSLSGLQCGWPNKPPRVPECMKMVTNIYVYAMTR
jgi:hypothetical protein